MTSLYHTYRAIFDSAGDADSKVFTWTVRILSVVAPGLIWFALAAPFKAVPEGSQLASVLHVDDARCYPDFNGQALVATVLAALVLVFAHCVVAGWRGSSNYATDGGTKDRALLFLASALLIVGLVLAFLDAIEFDNRWEEVVLAFSAFCMLVEEVRLLRKYGDSMAQDAERVREARKDIETMREQTKESVERIPVELAHTIFSVFNRGEEEHGHDSGGDGRS